MSETINQQKLDFLNNISINFQCSLPKKTIQETGFDTINALCDREIAFWSDTKHKCNPINLWANYFERVRGRLQEIKKYVNESDDINGWTAKWNEYISSLHQSHNREVGVILSSESFSSFLKSLANNSTNESQAGEVISGALLFYLNVQTSSVHNIIKQAHYSLLGFMSAFEFKNPNDSRTEQEEKAIEQLRKTWDEKTKKLQTYFDEIVKKYDSWKMESATTWSGFYNETNLTAKKLIEDKTTELNNLVAKFDADFNEKAAAYKEKLSLEAPVEYWRNRAKKYKDVGDGWLTWAKGVTITLVVLLSICLYLPPEAFKGSIIDGDPLAIRGIIILATIISFGAYLIRLFVKMTLSSYHLERDSEEREQLTLVYLALIKDGKIDKENRDYILQSLFSRAETGLLGDDSGPTMPGIDRVMPK